jgi:hypothetical protein
VQKVFSKYYGHFEYPFFNADGKRHQLPEPNQLRYYEDVSHWINSEAYKIEHEAMVKDFYRELATKPLTDDQITGYRLALVFIKNYEGRLGALAEEYKLLKKTSQRSSKL